MTGASAELADADPKRMGGRRVPQKTWGFRMATSFVSPINSWLFPRNPSIGGAKEPGLESGGRLSNS